VNGRGEISHPTLTKLRTSLDTVSDASGLIELTQLRFCVHTTTRHKTGHFGDVLQAKPLSWLRMEN